MLIDIHHETARGDILTLKEELVILWRGKVLVVPEGFESDGASVPRFLWGSVSPQIHPSTLRGAVAHDFLCRTTPDGWTRKEADELFYDLIREDGLSWWKAQKAYWGVRLFGGGAWVDRSEGKTGRDRPDRPIGKWIYWGIKKKRQLRCFLFQKKAAEESGGGKQHAGGYEK